MHIVTMLLLLSILILVHELGHFGVARLFKITVERFGFGLPFGPTLYEGLWGKTKVCVHAFLLGGYVSFPDDNPESELDKDDPGRISNRPVWQRFCVVSAGVIANALFAYVLVLLVAAFSGGLPSGSYQVYSAGLQSDKTLSAHQIGIQSGDKIIAVNGVEVDSPYKFIMLAQFSKKNDGYVSESKINSQIKLLKEKNPQLTKLTPNTIIPVNTKIILPSISFEEPVKLTQTQLTTQSPKPEGIKLTQNQQNLRNQFETKGFYISNGIVTLNDIAVASADNVHPLYITVERNGEKTTLAPAYPNKDGIIGIKLKTEEIRTPTKNIVSILSGSWDYIYKNTYYMISGLANIITGKIPLKDVHGVVAITKIGSDIITHKGIWDGLLLAALISMDLAIVNLLPIPALDGGHLFFLLIEKIIGRPVNQQVQETFAKYGFLFLIGLMIFIVFNDIFALVTDKL